MNCTKIEKLLPLYVEGDLSGRDADRITSHLSCCEACRALLEEFEASQERLRNFAVPDFGAEFYAQLRGAVMSEINSAPPARPSIFQSLRALFPARPLVAASLASLALFCALTFFIYRAMTKEEASLAAIEASMADFNPDLPATDEARPVSNGTGMSGAGRTGFAARNTSQRTPQRRTPARATPGTSSPQTTDAADSAQAAARPDGAPPAKAPVQVIARMNIQTSDPNIRIIWLGRKASE